MTEGTSEGALDIWQGKISKNGIPQGNNPICCPKSCSNFLLSRVTEIHHSPDSLEVRLRS